MSSMPDDNHLSKENKLKLKIKKFSDSPDAPELTGGKAKKKTSKKGSKKTSKKTSKKASKKSSKKLLGTSRSKEIF